MWPNPQDFWASLIPLYSKTSTQKDMESQVTERKTNCVHINIFSMNLLCPEMPRQIELMLYMIVK